MSLQKLLSQSRKLSEIGNKVVYAEYFNLTKSASSEENRFGGVLLVSCTLQYYSRLEIHHFLSGTSVTLGKNLSLCLLH